MTTFNLASYLLRFPEALSDRYKDEFAQGRKSIEERFKPIRSGQLLKPEDVLAIFDPSLPYVRDWTKPDYEQLTARMNCSNANVAILIKQLPGRNDVRSLMKQILDCLRDLSLVALILHHVYPDRFAIVSHHLASLLHVSGDTVSDYYVEYCDELRVWSQKYSTLSKLSVVETEFALWTWYRFANYGSKEERRLHRRGFFDDPWIQERRAIRIAESLGRSPTTRLGLARSYMGTDPTIAVMIAGRELEASMRDALASGRGMDFRELLRRLPPDALPDGTSKQSLADAWDRRNVATHSNVEIVAKEAEKVLRTVSAFLEHNAPDSRHANDSA